MLTRESTRRALGLLGGAAVLMAAGACGSSSTTTTATSSSAGTSGGGAASASTTSAAATTAAAANPVIGVDYPRSDTDFWNSYISYVPKFATTLGIDAKTTNSQNDIQKLIANIQVLEGQSVKAIVMAPQDTAAIVPTLADLSAKHIPVVTIDTLPDAGDAYMVVRANNLAYGQKACMFLGQKMKGTGSVAELMGGQDSINGRDRRSGFGDCMKANFPKIVVHEEPSQWMADLAASQLQTALASDKNIRGVYMHSSFALAGTLQVLKQLGLSLPASDPRHVFVVSNDGIPQELKDIRAGTLDATVSQPADQYAKYGLYYALAAVQGKTFSPGPTDHNSMIIQVRPGLLEDELSAPLVTIANVNDPSLWGNNAV